MKTCLLGFLLLSVLSAQSTLAGQAALLAPNSPTIFFTDLTSGPNSGGENIGGTAGAYVTIYGNNFGATQGNSTVTLNSANCGRVVTWGATWNWYQKIVYQLGPTCTSGQFVVTVAGQASICENNEDGANCGFTVRSGNIRCVSIAGNDGNPGTFAGGCWATMKKSIATVAAGDITYVENGVSITNDDGSGNRSVLGIGTIGGASGTASMPIALVAYPGATVTIGNLSGSPAGEIAVRAYNSYYVIAGMRMMYDQGIYTGGSGQRIIANDISCWNPSGVQGGCYQASLTNSLFVYGNYIHDTLHNNSKQGHALYLSTDANHDWVAWNKLYNNTTCYSIQVHSSPLVAGTGNNQYDIHIHDNQINGDTCNGINLATVDPSKGAVEVYNNMIQNTGLQGSGIYPDLASYQNGCIYAAGILNNGAAGSGTVQIYNNTLYNCGSSSVTYPTKAAFILLAGSEPNVKYQLTNNVTKQTSSATTYVGGDNSQYLCSPGTNDWFGSGGVPGLCAGDLNLDPLFNNALTGDLGLQATSPLIGIGSTTRMSTHDVNGLRRPVPPSIGAYELTASTSPAGPNPPTNLVIIVN